MKVKIYTINFNTNELTNSLIKSIFKNSCLIDFEIVVIDNSTEKRFILDAELADRHNISVIDNFDSNIIDFKDIIANSSDYTGKTPNNYGSLKHTYTINWIIEHETNNFLLFDSDTLLINKIDFIDDQYITIAGICHQQPVWKDKFVPYIQYFNVNMIKNNNIKYFDKYRIMFGTGNTSNNYDTGTSFLEDVLSLNLKYREIQFTDYILHLSGGSWCHDYKKFLADNKKYYE